MKAILEQAVVQLPKGRQNVLWAVAGTGVLAFVVGLATGSAERVWEALLLNTVFWGGIAQVGIMLSVIWQVTDAKWGRAFKRVAEGLGAFLPVTFVMFILIFFGAGHLYEWVHHPHAPKAGYFALPFFISRNLTGLLLMYGISFFFLMASIKPDLALARKLIPGWGGKFADWVLKGYGDHDQEVIRLEALSRKLAPLLGVVYAVVISMVAFDFVMSLDQTWFSTLFGVFFFVSSIYTTLALMLVIMWRLRQLPGVDEYVTINRMHDLAKLTFAFAMLWNYMVFSQYLIIWYSNLPEETPYLVSRSWEATPWKPIFWTLWFVLFLFPFLGLMSRTVCRRPPLTALVGAILFVGQYFSFYLLVVPSIQDRHPNPSFLMGYQEILVTAGFGAGFFLCFFAFMSRVPILPISDKHLTKTWHGR